MILIIMYWKNTKLVATYHANAHLFVTKLLNIYLRAEGTKLVYPLPIIEVSATTW